MKKRKQRCGDDVPRQVSGTWRLVLDMTDEQAAEFRQIMFQHMKLQVTGTARLLELMRAGAKAEEPKLQYMGTDGKWHTTGEPTDGKVEEPGFMWIPSDDQWHKVKIPMEGKNE